METTNKSNDSQLSTDGTSKGKKFLHSITFKIIVVIPLALSLLIPKLMIQQLIEERQDRKNDVTSEIYEKWGKNQTFTGPVLIVPYKSKDVEDSQMKLHYAYFLPEQLKISGGISPELKYYGIYKVPVYSSAMKVSGEFNKPDFSAWKVPDENILWDRSYLVLGITDLSGIQNRINIKWNDTIYQVSPGTVNGVVAFSGVNSNISIVPADSYKFSFDLNLNGTERLGFVPIGRETSVDLKSSWSDPGFEGSFSPDKKDISSVGFTASWNILDLNRSFPQQWTDKQDFRLDTAWFGVNLFTAVDHYQQLMRSAKYAIMFISLTFIVFLFVEALNKKQIHVVMYALVGLALLMFYSLLLSLSEQIGFNYAYLVSSVAIIGMITIYSHGALRNFKLTALLLLILAVLYTFMYCILQLQDFSLLLGSIGLFIVLAIIMALSRKVDWYV